LPLLSHLLSQLSPSGLLAIQAPDDFHRPSHTLMNDIAVDMEQRGLVASGTAARLHRTSAQTERGSGGLQAYYDHLRLSGQCASIDCWETNYYQTISCPLKDRHPIAYFLMGSSLNQFMAGLPEEVREAFLDQYVTGLEREYPVWREKRGSEEELVCCFPFNRWFIVVTKK